MFILRYSELLEQQFHPSNDPLEATRDDAPKRIDAAYSRRGPTRVLVSVVGACTAPSLHSHHFVARYGVFRSADFIPLQRPQWPAHYGVLPDLARRQASGLKSALPRAAAV